MRAEDFVALRRDDWNQLEDLLAKSSSGRLKPLTPAQVLTLAALYRRATADLARAQRDWPGQPVQRYLNGLVARGHGIVYRRGGAFGQRIRSFYVETLPRTYRESWRYVVASAALFFVPAIVSYFVVLANPDAAYSIAPPNVINSVHHHELWTHIPPEERVATGGLISVNNIWISMLAFAFGVAFGLPVIWVLINNGIHLGGIFGLVQAYGLTGGLFEFVIAHGVMELSIVIAQGAGGLMMGWALISPANRKRSDALVIATRRGFTLLLGLAPLLLIAGTIEGNVSASDAPFALKLMIGLSTGLLLYSYLLLSGHPETRKSEQRALLQLQIPFDQSRRQPSSDHV